MTFRGDLTGSHNELQPNSAPISDWQTVGRENVWPHTDVGERVNEVSESVCSLISQIAV